MDHSKVILFEYAKPTDLLRLMNFSAGIWSWVITPGAITVTDDNGNTGYHEDTNTIKYPIIDIRVDDLVRGYSLSYAEVFSLDDCRTVDSSWYYDTDTTRIYIHFEDFEPPIGKTIYFGAATGFTYNTLTDGYYFNDFYYEPRINSIGTIRRSIDPLFYGRLKYQDMKIGFINTEGFFDDWRSRNLFGQKTILRIGNDGDDYEDYDIIHQGFIEDDTRTFRDFEINIQDPRQGLTQPVASRALNTTDWPYLNEDDVGEAYPVRYGTLRNVPCICLNSEAVAPGTYTFLLGDTTFNSVSSLTEVRVLGVAKVPSSTNLAGGTFTLAAADCLDIDGNLALDDVTADMVWPISNGVEIIKDLMFRYDGKNYLPSFWDTTEVDAASAASRATSLTIDKLDTQLNKAIELVCFDIDARFYTHDDGRLTIRLYDENRTPIKTIYKDEWMDNPTITNNGSEFLTSCVIKYDQDQADERYRTYEELSYQTAAFDRYKKLKSKEFETGLFTAAAAQAKAETIMNISSDVSDIIKRTTKWQNSEIEASDFVICDPVSRLDEVETLAVYEVLSVDKNLATLDCTFSFRYVKEYVAPYVRIIDTDEYRETDTGDYRIAVI
jgi:hypothetical protein